MISVAELVDLFRGDDDAAACPKKELAAEIARRCVLNGPIALRAILYPGVPPDELGHDVHDAIVDGWNLYARGRAA